MKKFIATLLLVVICFTLGACNNSDKNSNSIQVQQITYTLGGSTPTLTSRFYFDYILEEVSVTEYENATEKLEKYYTAGIIEVDGTVSNQGNYSFNNGDTPKQLKDYIGKTYYCPAPYIYGICYKITYTAVHISYLNVTFINDSTFELSYYDNSLKRTQTSRIKTDNYKIVYFSTAK